MLDQVDGTAASLLLRHKINSAASLGWSVLRIHWYTSPVHGPAKCLHRLDSYLLRKGKRIWAFLSIHRRVVISGLKHISIILVDNSVRLLLTKHPSSGNHCCEKVRDWWIIKWRSRFGQEIFVKFPLSSRVDSDSTLAPSLNERTENPPCRCSSDNRIANSLQARYVVAFQSSRCQSRCSYINMYSVKYWTWIIKINNF